MFRNKNKKTLFGTYEVKPRAKFFNRKIFVTVLLIFVFGVSGFYGVKNMFKKQVVSSALTQVSESDIPGWWLQQYFGESVCNSNLCAPSADPDEDKLTNSQEFYYHSSPVDQDTNKNGLKDGEDVANNYDPSKPGKVSFDEISSDEGILGESLLFDQDIKKLLSDMTDPSKITLPEIKTEEIIISKDDSKEARTVYLNNLSQSVEKYFNFDVEKTLKSAAENGDSDQIDEIKARSLKLSIDLKALPTPPSTAQLHKYYISLVQLIPKVITLPGASTLGTDTNENDVWFDNAQAYFVILQKIAIEKQKIKQLN